VATTTTTTTPSSELTITSQEFLLAFNWPTEIFYFLNEELANLNRQLIKQDAPAATSLAGGSDLFLKFLNLLKAVFILSN
jgi:hypothetical protein